MTGIDSSATHSFTQIKQAADNCSARLVLVNVSAALTNAFRAIGFLSKDIIIAPDLDHALEWCEDAIIATHRKDDSAIRSLREWLTEALDSVEYANRLAQQFKRIPFGPGETIARQGQRSDSMHFILEGYHRRSGRWADDASAPLGAAHHYRRVGLITQRPRSATIEAEVASVVYELRIEDYERLKIDQPALTQALLTYVIKVMAERLSFASRLIGVLQR